MGLSLVYIVSMNGMLQYAIRLSAEVENLVRETRMILCEMKHCWFRWCQ